MQLDWTTFGLEALNFVVLVWLLKHFFYRPVLAIIEARRAATAKTIADAQAVRRQAEELKSEYQTHLANADEKRATAKAQLDEEIAADRVRRLAALAAEIDDERKRRNVLEAGQRSELELALERKAMTIELVTGPLKLGLIAFNAQRSEQVCAGVTGEVFQIATRS